MSTPIPKSVEGTSPLSAPQLAQRLLHLHLRSLFRVGLLGLFCLGPTSVGASVLHVAVAGGTDTAGCGGAASPCASIQQAVNLAPSRSEIRVAEGVYVHQAMADPCPPSNTGVVCVVDKKVEIYGGYESGNWTNRNPASFASVIEGSGQWRGVLVTRTFPGAPAAALVLDGFTVRNGLAQGQVGASPDGANGRGGGLKAALSDVTVRDVLFMDNEALGVATAEGAGGEGTGGAIFVASTVELPGRVVLERVRLEGNRAVGGVGTERGGFAVGGGMFMNRGVLVAVDLDLADNEARAGSSPGQGVVLGQRADALGGGIAVMADAEATLSRLTAAGNLAVGGASSGLAGGGFGGGVYAERAVLDLEECSLMANSAAGASADEGGLGAGGGLMSFDATVSFRRCRLVGNEARGGDGPTKKGSAGGGGAYLERAADPGVTATVSNSVIADNLVALGVGGGSVGGGGGGLFVLGNQAMLEHVTLAGNRLDSSPLVGQALVVVPRLGAPSTAGVAFSIVAHHDSLTNVAAVQVQSGATVTFTRPLFYDNSRNTNAGIGSPGSINGLDTALPEASPAFVSPGVPNHDYHLTSASAAIDQAPSSQALLDLDGGRRGAPRDLGADEYCFAALDDVVLDAGMVSGSSTVTACQTIQATDYVVQGSGSLELQAGRRVVLGEGFHVLTGGRLVIVNEIP